MNSKQIFQVSFLSVIINYIWWTIYLISKDFGFDINIEIWFTVSDYFISYLAPAGILLFIMGISKIYDKIRIPAIFISICECGEMVLLTAQNFGWDYNWWPIYKYIKYVAFILPLFLLLFTIFKDEKFNQIRKNILCQ